MHAEDVEGRPDFFFPRSRLALFIDGCFWHSCSSCHRPLPGTNRGYWAAKIRGNVRRAAGINGVLRREGLSVVRIWEHELGSEASRAKLARRLSRRPSARFLAAAL
jgi:DNA mismatch endonuclease (patch repair protein)